VLAADTAATTSGASTSFSVLNAGLLGTTIGAQAVKSNSAINTSGSCQTASGGSNAVGVNVTGTALANVAKSSESSNACTGQTPTQTASSSVIGLSGTGVPIPAAGCADGTPNTLTGLPVLLPIICNADSTTQLAVPSGVREALTVLGIQVGSSAVLKSVVAAAESYAIAPAAATPKCKDGDKDCGTGPNGGPEVCVNGQDPDNDGDCTNAGGSKCKDGDKDCGIGPNGTAEICVNGHDPDGDGDCKASSISGGSTCKDTDKDCKNGNTGAPGSCSVDQQDNDGDCDGSGSVSGANSGGNDNGNGEGTGATGNAGSGLPFTGQNLLEVVLLGLLLTGGGLLLYARSREQKR
jgi:hypothetical protein